MLLRKRTQCCPKGQSSRAFVCWLDGWSPVTCSAFTAVSAGAAQRAAPVRSRLPDNLSPFTAMAGEALKRPSGGAQRGGPMSPNQQVAREHSKTGPYVRKISNDGRAPEDRKLT